MKNLGILVSLCSFYLLLIRYGLAVDCTLLLEDTSCQVDEEGCYLFVVNTEETACVNCSTFDGTYCGSQKDMDTGGVCSSYIPEPESYAYCILNCTLKVGIGCSSDSTCENYILDS
jgi:hypothetical protein